MERKGKSNSNSFSSMVTELSSHAESSTPSLHKSTPHPNGLVTVGAYLAERLVSAGCKHVFSLAGDYTLALLSELCHVQELTLVSNCNELNAGYAADGYARATNGLAVLVVTYMVGSLSALSAVAGAYSEDLPLLVICCGPNLRDYSSHRVMHHTTGGYYFNQSAECYAPVVRETCVVRHLEEAPGRIDHCLTTCLSTRKPVYLELACNLAQMYVSPPNPLLLLSPAANPVLRTDPSSLSSSLEDAMLCIHQSTRPVLLIGNKLRGVEHSLKVLAENIGCGVAAQPNGKGIFDEKHPQYMGCFWGCISSPGCEEIVESSDLVIALGTVWSDATTVGWTTLKKPLQTIAVHGDSVQVCGRHYSRVGLSDFVEALAKHVPQRPASLTAFRRTTLAPTPVPAPKDEAPLTRLDILHCLQSFLTSSCSVVAETGDCWFIGDALSLPTGCTYHVQLMYGSIGWAVGAALGVGLGTGNKRKVVALIGDGAFQMTVQELSTLIRHEVNATIFLVNNSCYGIECALHDGPYNYLKNWSYAQLVDTFAKNSDKVGRAKGIKVTTAGELTAAVKEVSMTEGTVLIECCIQKDDCSPKLLKWGRQLATADMAMTHGHMLM